MRKVFLSLIFTMIFGGAYAVSAQNVQQVTVRVKTQKSVMRDRLRIRVVSIEDSRCPKDVTCVWAGNAKVTVRLTNRNGRVETFDLNTSIANKSVNFGGFEITLGNVSPYPRSNVRLNANAYTASFTVRKI